MATVNQTRHRTARVAETGESAAVNPQSKRAIWPPKAGEFYRAYAPKLVDNGYSVVSVLPGTKKPRHPEWHAACFKPTDPDFLERAVDRHPSDSVGIACGTVIGVDIDMTDEVRAHELQQVVEGIFGPSDLIRVGEWPKRLIVYRTKDKIDKARLPCNIDMLGRGAQFVAFGKHPQTHRPYSWIGCDPIHTPLDRLPLITAVDVGRLARTLGAPSKVGTPANDNTPTSGRPKPLGASKLLQAVVRDQSGRVIDGREAFLSYLIWNEYFTGIAVSLLADRAWRRFCDEADLTRPKGSGKRCWTRKDALAKAKAICKKDPKKSGYRPKPETPAAVFDLLAPSFWDDSQKRRSIARVTDWFPAPSVRAVHAAMLGAVDFETGRCRVNVRELVAKTGMSRTSVTNARKELIAAGFWFSSRGVYVPISDEPASRKQDGPDSRGEDGKRVQVDLDSLYRSLQPSSVPSANDNLWIDPEVNEA